MNNIVIVMDKLICSICGLDNWVFIKTREEYEALKCTCCEYLLYKNASFLDRISWKYRKYFKEV